MIFVAKNIRASRVNLLQNDYAAGLPSPLSFIGLTDALMRDLELTPWTGRVIPVLHSVTISNGRTKPEMENKSGVFAPIETMEDLTGTIDVSLLLDLPGCDSASDVTSAIMRRRIAGGIIQNNHITVERVVSDGTAFRSIPRGYAIVRPEADSPKYLKISGGDEASLSTVLDLLLPSERLPGSGWIVPVAAGYRLLESPEAAPKRIRLRDPKLPHVFAEPLLGIAELISVRSARLSDLTTDGLKSIFWSWHAEGEFVLGHPSYLPEAIYKEDIVHG